MSLPLLRPLGFGEILDGGFVLYRRHFTVLFATTLVALLPVTVATGVWMGLIQQVSPDGAGVLGAVGGLLLVLAASVFSWSVILGALVRQVGGAVAGGEVSMADGFRHALRRFVPISLALVISAMATSFGSMLALIPVGIVFGVLVAVMAVAGSVSPAVPLVGIILMTVAMLVAMLLLMSGFFAVAPVVTLEERGPFDAIGRSWTLAHGARFRIIGVLIVTIIIITLPALAVGLLAGGATSMFDPNAAGRVTTTQLALQQTLSLLINGLTMPFLIACITLLYFDRRVRTEAYDLEAAADGLPVGS